MSRHIIRRVLTRLLFELQLALWHQPAQSEPGPKKIGAARRLMR